MPEPHIRLAARRELCFDPSNHREMSYDFEPPERAHIQAALAAGEIPTCPSCSGRLDRTEIPPRGDVSYVRRRVWLMCGSCDKSLVLDHPKAF